LSFSLPTKNKSVTRLSVSTRFSWDPRRTASSSSAIKDLWRYVESAILEPVEALLRRLLIVGKYNRIRKAFKKLTNAQFVRRRRFRPLVGLCTGTVKENGEPREILRFTAH
jgi:hypothetical protein